MPSTSGYAFNNLIFYEASIQPDGQTFFETRNMDAPLASVYYVKSHAQYYTAGGVLFHNLELLKDTNVSTWSGRVNLSPYQGQTITMRTDHIAYNDLEVEVYRYGSVVTVVAT